MAAKPRILVAEDELDIRDLIAATLEFSGFEVASARDGVEAVRLAGQDRFDLILLDVRMPRMNGYEACAALRQAEKTAAIPIIFLSAKGQEAEVDAGLAAGASDYIVKPFGPEALARRIREVLAANLTP
jgi:DNA-binding response OmpR family regulator